MKLRRLRLCGIGPFRSVNTIDFDAVGTNGIFLLEGPTGAGKSTVIDAITWALYGTVTGGADSTVERIRSTHADPGEESYVELWFTVDSGTFRVRRTPQWQRPGRKTPIATTAKLWKLPEGAYDDGDLEAGEVLSSKAADVGSEIAERIGLNSRQFVQTMVLPQGKFAEFLRLSSEERTTLLEQIFDTSVYRRFTEIMRQRAIDARRDGEEHAHATLTAISTLATLLGHTREDIDAYESTIRDAVIPDHAAPAFEQLEAELEEASARSAKLDRASTEAAALFIRAQDAQVEAHALSDALKRRSELLSTQEALAGRAPVIEDLAQMVSRHRSASEFIPLVDRAQKARNALTLATDGAPGISPDDATQQIHDLNQAIRDLTRESGAVDELVAEEEHLALAHTQLTTMQKEHEEIQHELDAAAEQLLALPQQLKQAHESCAEADRAASDEAGALAAVAQAKSLRDALNSLDDLRERITRTEIDTQAALAAASQAEQHHREVTDAWFHSAAAILSARLEGGVPCPVCGSVEHPSPAPSDSITATKEDVDHAARAASAARDSYDKLRRSSDALRAEEASLEVLCGDATPSQAQEELDRAQGEVARIRSIVAEKDDRGLLLANLDITQKELSQRAEELRIKEASLSAVLTQRRFDDKARTEKILLATKGFANAAALRDDLQNRIALATSQAAQLAAVVEARAALRTADRELSEALDHSPFSSPEDVEQSVLPDATLADYAKRISEHRDATRDTDIALADPRIATLTGAENPRLDQLDAALAAAQITKDSAIDAATVARIGVKQSEKEMAHARDVFTQWQRAYARSGAILRLSELAQGGASSTTRIPLSTFAVQQRFDRVVARANEHLEEISLGRYSLLRIDEKEKGTRKTKAGLGLVITDHLGSGIGDTERSTRSLSGGETFYSSLALALGLADTVTADNGGIRLDTLLIDEGFGALSESVLDQVLHVLTTLSSSGRTVGIISHVEELKKMINERIVVSPLPDGSSVIHTAS